MPIDTVLNARFAIGRFAHFLALEKRDLVGLNGSTSRAALRSPQYRSPQKLRRANGSLIVLNGWQHSAALLSRIAARVTPGPVALYYGDDESWTAETLEGFRKAIGSRLVRHFAMNVDASAAVLPHVLQVPIGLNGASIELPGILASEGYLQAQTHHRSSKLLCCCQRAWPQRERAFAALRESGHPHCNLTERRPYASLFRSYLRARFVVSVHGHGLTDFREWEILLAGAVPVVDYIAAHDRLFEGLPVVRVKEWASVTPAFLEEEWARIQAAAAADRVDWRKAYFPYWFGQMTAHMTPGI